MVADTLFELTPPTEEELRQVRLVVKKIAAMHRTFGVTEGQRCAACAHLVRWEYAGTYFKCREYGMTHGRATDWRLRWPACGKFVHTNTNNGGDQ